MALGTGREWGRRLEWVWRRVNGKEIIARVGMLRQIFVMRSDGGKEGVEVEPKLHLHNVPRPGTPITITMNDMKKMFITAT